MARVVLTNTARAELAALPVLAQESVRDCLDWLAIAPRGGYALFGRLRGQRSIRVPGNYRIVYRIDGANDERVVVRSIRHRSRAYL